MSRPVLPVEVILPKPVVPGDPPATPPHSGFEATTPWTEASHAEVGCRNYFPFYSAFQLCSCGKSRVRIHMSIIRLGSYVRPSFAAAFPLSLRPFRFGNSDSVIPHDALTAEASAPPRALHVRGDFPGPRHPRPPPSGIPFGCTVLRVSLPCPRESGRAWPPSRAESVRRRTPPRVLPQGSSQQRRQRHQPRCVMEEQPLPPRPHTCPPRGAAQLPHPRLQPGPPSPASPGDGLGVRPLPFTPSPDPRALGHLLALRSGDCSSAT